jgi:hypothetical protein
VVEKALGAMADALRTEVATLRADRTLQGRTVLGGFRVGTAGKRTTYAFPDVPGAGLPDDTPIRLVLDDGREVDGEVATRNDRELVVALAEDIGASVEHAVLIADASFLLERLAARLDEVLDDESPLDLDTVAKVLGLEPITPGRAAVPAAARRALNGEQADAVALALGSDVTFVWGPPGTGKTTTVAHVVAAHALAGRSVLLVANTNTAVDTALERVASLLDGSAAIEEGKVLRYGTVVHETVAHLSADAVAARVAAPLLTERATLSARLGATDDEAEGQGTLDADHDLVAERSALRDRMSAIDTAVEAAAAGLADNALVVATTVYQTWLGGLPERDWDVVVVDEASMLMLPMAAYAAGLASSSVVVAGDFRQLPAIVTDTSPEVNEWLARDAFVAIGLPSLLAAGTPPPWLAALRTQYRMRPEIAGLVTSLFYEDNPLATGRSAAPSATGLLAGGAPLLYVDTSALGAWAGVAGRGSRFNPVHAVLVAALLSALPEGTAGVVTPYAAQERLVAALLTDRHGPDARSWVSTVHRFQGNEQDVVVVDLADAYGASPGPASRATGRDDPQARLLNVAVSRARDQLVVLGHGEFLASRTPRRGMAESLFGALRTGGAPVPLDEVVRGAFAVAGVDGLAADLDAAAEEVAVFTPRVSGHGMARWSGTLRSLIASGVAVRVVTQPPAEQPYAAALLDQMREAGVAVDLWAGMAEKAVVIDASLTWLGGTDLGLPVPDGAAYLRVKGTALPAALADLLRPARARRRPLGEPTNDPCPACGSPTVLKRGGGAAAFVCTRGRDCPGLQPVADEDRDDEPVNATGPCRQPGCAGWLVPREGRYGRFTSCSRYPACAGR